MKRVINYYQGGRLWCHDLEKPFWICGFCRCSCALLNVIQASLLKCNPGLSRSFLRRRDLSKSSNWWNMKTALGKSKKISSLSVADAMNIYSGYLFLFRWLFFLVSALRLQCWCLWVFCDQWYRTVFPQLCQVDGGDRLVGKDWSVTVTLSLFPAVQLCLCRTAVKFTFLTLIYIPVSRNTWCFLEFGLQRSQSELW